MDVSENPFEMRSCYDCAFCQSAMSLWCVNKDAIKARGTSIPGVIHCPYWKPDWSRIDGQYKKKENGYKGPFKETVKSAVRYFKFLFQ